MKRPAGGGEGGHRNPIGKGLGLGFAVELLSAREGRSQIKFAGTRLQNQVAPQLVRSELDHERGYRMRGEFAKLTVNRVRECNRRMSERRKV